MRNTLLPVLTLVASLPASVLAENQLPYVDLRPVYLFGLSAPTTMTSDESKALLFTLGYNADGSTPAWNATPEQKAAARFPRAEHITRTFPEIPASAGSAPGLVSGMPHSKLQATGSLPVWASYHYRYQNDGTYPAHLDPDYRKEALTPSVIYYKYTANPLLEANGLNPATHVAIALLCPTTQSTRACTTGIKNPAYAGDTGYLQRVVDWGFQQTKAGMGVAFIAPSWGKNDYYLVYGAAPIAASGRADPSGIKWLATGEPVTIEALSSTSLAGAALQGPNFTIPARPATVLRANKEPHRDLLHRTDWNMTGHAEYAGAPIPQNPLWPSSQAWFTGPAQFTSLQLLIEDLTGVPRVAPIVPGAPFVAPAGTTAAPAPSMNTITITPTTNPTTPFEIKGARSASGGLSVEIRVSESDLGQPGAIYMLAQYQGHLFVKTALGWQLMAGNLLTAPLPSIDSTSISVIGTRSLANFSETLCSGCAGLAGLKLWAGYGRSFDDMISGQKFSQVFDL